MSKKYKTLDISGELLLSMFANGIKPTHEIIDGIPADAKIINVKHGWPNQIGILLESEEFEEVPEGQPIPTMFVKSRIFAPQPEPLV